MTKRDTALCVTAKRAEIRTELELARYAMAVMSGSAEALGKPLTTAEVELFQTLATQQHYPASAMIVLSNRALFFELPAAAFWAHVVRHPAGALLSARVSKGEIFHGVFPDLKTTHEHLAEFLFTLTGKLVGANQRHSSQARN